jgi:hypothetical protein
LGAPLSSAATETPPTTDGECVGYGCSPEQDAELNESEREANDGIPDEATTAAEIAPRPTCEWRTARIPPPCMTIP